MWQSSSNLYESGWPAEYRLRGPGLGPLTLLNGTGLAKEMPSLSDDHSQLPWRRTRLDENFRFAHKNGNIYFQTFLQDAVCEKEIVQEEIAETLRAKHWIRVYMKDDGTVAAKFVHVLSDLQKCYRYSLPWDPVWFSQDSYNLFVEGPLCAHHIQGKCSKADANSTCKFLHKDLDQITEVLNELVDGVEEQLSDAASSFVSPVAMEAFDAAVHMAGSEEQASVGVMRYQ